MHKILITGGAGFAGSNLAIKFKTKYPDAEVIAFDNLKRRGSELNLARFKEAGVRFVHGDIRNPSDLNEVGEITHLIDACAEPSVHAGINGSPQYLTDTNLVGTINCLNYAREKKAAFVFLSTSRIYPIQAIETANYDETPTRFHYAPNQNIPGLSERGVAENLPLEGYRSLYGATKLASELLIHEYQHYFGMKTVINRCGVLTGPWQMGKVDQGFVVLWLTRHLWKKKLSYIGYGGFGKQCRDILHIDDLFRLVDMQVSDPEKFNGKLFNVGGGVDCSFSLLELTALCEELTGNKIEINPVPETSNADIRVYITDAGAVEKFCGWKPQIDKKATVKEILDWIKQYEKELMPILG